MPPRVPGKRGMCSGQSGLHGCCSWRSSQLGGLGRLTACFNMESASLHRGCPALAARGLPSITAVLVLTLTQPGGKGPVPLRRLR